MSFTRIIEFRIIFNDVFACLICFLNGCVALLRGKSITEYQIWYGLYSIYICILRESDCLNLLLKFHFFVSGSHAHTHRNILRLTPINWRRLVYQFFKRDSFVFFVCTIGCLAVSLYVCFRQNKFKYMRLVCVLLWLLLSLLQLELLFYFISFLFLDGTAINLYSKFFLLLFCVLFSFPKVLFFLFSFSSDTNYFCSVPCRLLFCSRYVKFSFNFFVLFCFFFMNTITLYPTFIDYLCFWYNFEWIFMFLLIC